MKRTLLSAAAVIAMVLAGCTSMPDTFGSAESSPRNDVSVIVDRFSGTRTYAYKKGLRGGFALSHGMMSTDYLEFYPSLVVSSENICTPSLRIVYRGSSGGMLATASNKVYERFIFLNSDGKRLELRHSVTPDMEVKIEDSYVGSDFFINRAGEYNLILTKSQFDELRDYFSSSKTVECAAYSTDNKAVTFKSYNNGWHQNVFTALDESIRQDRPTVVYNEFLTQAEIR